MLVSILDSYELEKRIGHNYTINVIIITVFEVITQDPSVAYLFICYCLFVCLFVYYLFIYLCHVYTCLHVGTCDGDSALSCLNK